MNCKPGDLAVVLRPTTTDYCSFTDHFVTVVARAVLDSLGMATLPDGSRINHSGLNFGASWIVELATEITMVSLEGKNVRSRFYTMWDHRLRPLRDPGNDATDETLLWLPVPSKEVA